MDLGPGAEARVDDRAATAPTERAVDPADLARDARLVKDALAGDRAAADRLAQRLMCVPRVLGAINSRRGGRLSSHDLEDLIGDCLLGIWRKLGSYHGEATLEGWLYRFCFLEFMNKARLLSRRPEVSKPELAHHESSADPLDRDLEREDLERTLDRLGPPDADVVRLKHFDELTFEGIAKAMGITTKMAKTRYYRGIAWLQRELSVQLRGSRA
ncbi:MAG TPA: sigma-70 family RNA polymerase sigma factor [Thermoanaerobaculia bacterium]|nr:sigma-70 family RNA polymerase sigma factor [Thermoanaerobaculia bacterium]